MLALESAEAGVSQWLVNGIVLLFTLATLAWLFRPAWRSSELWRATVTPLASIIGSGFLVIAPLLAFMAGRLAVVAILVISLLAWLTGSAVRYNIRHIEAIAEADNHGKRIESVLQWLERSSKFVLGFAYVIAVAFYLELLGAFVLRLFGIEGHLLQKWIATALLLVIGGVSLWRGLSMLEGMEEYAVNIKLAIIAGFLAALFYFNAELAIEGQWRLPQLDTHWDLHTFFELLGAFLIVQGFETSRYLRGAYAREVRIRSMRIAQLISGAIYIVFIALVTVLFDRFNGISETGIIDLSGRVALLLPYLLVAGAVMAQFSAAVADTISFGGLVEEASRGYIRRRIVYAVAVLLAGVLVWSSNIFTVIAYASRAFAAFYAIQAAMAAINAFRPHGGGRLHPWRGILYSLLTVLLVVAALFGIPVESQGG